MDSIEDLKANFNYLGMELSDRVLAKSFRLCRKYDITAEDFVDQWSAFTASNLDGSAPTIETLETLERKELKTKKRSENSIVISPKISEKTNPKSSTPGKGSRNQENIPEHDVSQLEISNISENYNYSQREDSLKVLLSYGSDMGKNFKKSTRSVLIKQWNKEGKFLSSDAKYMFEIMRGMAGKINRITQNLGSHLIKKYHLEMSENFSKNYGKITTIGRICCDADAKLNSASVQLENIWKSGHGSRINLKVSRLSSYSLFPGKVLAVEGTIINSSTLIAQKLYSDCTLPLPIEDEITSDESIDMIVASGPFSLSDNIRYEPLQDLIKYAAQKKPNVLLLIGPFLDESQEKLCDESLLESYDSFFNNLVEGIMSPFKDQSTQVVLVASQKDLFHHPVYPTPAYVTKANYPNLHLVPDPSILKIDNIFIGVTATDIILHLSKEELNYGRSESDRMSRLVSHLLEQQSFYPLHPSNSEVRLNVNFLEKYGRMDVTPHLLILPSSLRYFVKEINGCLVVNPEKITKGYTAGTFAHLKISAPLINPIASKTNCDIIRI